VMPVYQTYPDQSYLMRSFFFNELLENKEPMPQPEDYQPEPFYSSELMGGLLKGYQPEGVSGSGWSLVVSLGRREDPFRQAIINASPGFS
jgi:hypothetical protein